MINHHRMIEHLNNLKRMVFQNMVHVDQLYPNPRYLYDLRLSSPKLRLVYLYAPSGVRWRYGAVFVEVQSSVGSWKKGGRCWFIHSLERLLDYWLTGRTLSRWPLHKQQFVAVAISRRRVKLPSSYFVQTDRRRVACIQCLALILCVFLRIRAFFFCYHLLFVFWRLCFRKGVRYARASFPQAVICCYQRTIFIVTNRYLW